MSYPSDPYRRPNPPQVNPQPGSGQGAQPGPGVPHPGARPGGPAAGQQSGAPGAPSPGGPQQSGPYGARPPGQPGPYSAPGSRGPTGSAPQGAPVGPPHTGSPGPGPHTGAPAGYPGAAPTGAGGHGYPGAAAGGGYPGAPAGPGYPGGPGGPQPPRKKRTGLIVGLVVGGFIVLALLVGGGLLARNLLFPANEPEPPETPVAQPTEEPAEQPTEEVTQAAGSEPDLAVGDCIVNPDVAGSLQTVDCDEPHFAQVYAQQEVEGDSYPSTGTLTESAQSFCQSGTAGALDPAKLSDDFTASYVIPTAESWGTGDRHIHCLVHRTDESDFSENLLPSS